MRAAGENIDLSSRRALIAQCSEYSARRMPRRLMANNKRFQAREPHSVRYRSQILIIEI